jgi:DNA (cytosine-5)-methyltransferase 1
MLKAVDLFCGIGGNSEGLRQAGVCVVRAADVWGLAIQYHSLNHKETIHDQCDLTATDFTSWEDFDILCASPPCQGHSRARGKERDYHDLTRKAAWSVVNCAKAKRPRYIMVENVVEFCKWSMFKEWVGELENLGYLIHVNKIDAANFGVPQNRRRLIITGVRKDISKSPLVLKQTIGEQPSAETFIDWNDGAWSLIEKPGRAKATLERIKNGRAMLGDRFLAAYYGCEKSGRSIKRPIGTITTRDRYSLIDGEKMRMLTANEYRKAMGFPDGYILPKQKRATIHLLGNAVAPGVAKAVAELFLQHEGITNDVLQVA